MSVGLLKSRMKRLLYNAGNHMVRPHVPAGADARTSASTKVAIAGIMLELQARARASAPLPRLCDGGFRVFSQFEEDGYLLYLAAVLELDPKIFLDIGAADGINSNCANLALNLGWHGLFIDGDPNNVARGRTFYSTHPDTSLYPPVFQQALVTAEK
jgi:hypothetical protein